MATKTIAELTDGGAPRLGDLAAIYRSGASRKVALPALVPDIVVPVGAAADNSTDDTSALQASADACAGTDKTLYISAGSYRFSTLDLREIKYIDGPGWLYCHEAAVGEAIKLGTSVNANTAMLGGSIYLRVRHNDGHNTDLTGSIGVRVYGSSHCQFTIHSYFFDQGILVSPENSASLYFAFNRLIACRTYGCATGLHLRTTGTSTGWINENSVQSGSFSPAGGVLEDVAGIRLSAAEGGSAPNHNKFNDVHVENWANPGVPIRIDKGIRNVFNYPRLEASDPALLGADNDDGVGQNVFISAYEQIGSKYPLVTWQAPYVNWLLPAQGAEWHELRNITIEDWQQDPDETGGYCPLLYNTVTDDSEFPAATFSDDAWKVNSTHRAAMWVPVTTGDIIAIDLDVVSGTSYMTLRAQDTSKADLSSLSEGDLPYIGSNDGSNAAQNTSGTGAAPGTITNSNYFRWQCVSINRSEVKFLKIELLPGAELRRVVVRRLVRNNSGSEVVSGPVEPMATIIERATPFYS